MDTAITNLCTAGAIAVAVLGFSVAAYYLARPKRVADVFAADDPLAARFKTLLSRRKFGAVMMIVIASMSLLGTGLMPDGSDLSWLCFWSVMLLMLLWFITLILLDMRETAIICGQITRRSHQRIIEIIESEISEALNDAQVANHSVPDDNLQT